MRRVGSRNWVSLIRSSTSFDALVTTTALNPTSQARLGFTAWSEPASSELKTTIRSA
jgi:hypothetical protein